MNKNKQGIFMRAPVQGLDEVIIDIIGAIGWEVGYQQLKDIISQIPSNTKKCTFEIYSPGGDVWDGNGCMQEIGELGKRCETVARIQMAASMATLIAVACNKRTMARNGRFLIHNAWTQTQGDADAHEKAALELRDCENEAAKFYAERCGGKMEDMLKLMAEERWMLPEEAQKLGFVHEIDDPFNVEDFKEVKEHLMATNKWPKALIELPVVETPKEENKDADKAPAGAAIPAPVESVAVEKPEDDIKTLLAAEYNRGEQIGIGKGKVVAMQEYIKEITSLKAELAKMEQKAVQAEKEASKHQSEKDKIAVQMVAVQKLSDERVASLRASLDEAAAQLKQFVSGSLSFEPAVETWEQAIAATGNDYAAAAKKYPELLKQFRARKETK